MSITRKSPTVSVFSQAFFDSLWILVACIVASFFTWDEDVSFRRHFADHIGYFVSFVIVWCGVATDQRVFSSHRGDTIVNLVVALLKAVVISLVLTSLLMLFFTQRPFEQEFLVHFGLWSALFLLSFRIAIRLFLNHVRSQGLNYRQILLVGGNERARHFVEVLRSQGHYGYRILGFIDDDPERASYFEGLDVPYLGDLRDIEILPMKHVIDEIYVCLPVRTYYETITSMAHLCEGIGTPIRLIADFFSVRIATSKVRQFQDVPLLSLSPVPEEHLQLLVKRMLDLAVSGFFLVTIAWWLFPVVAILIKLDSRGPVFFRQERVGFNGRRFNMVKFRSMVINAEEIKAQLAEMNEADGPVFKMRDDPRMTRVGRYIRKFSIDELPQFINVFLGHMSLVGPRPPVPAEVAEYTWDQRRRLSVRPGITGLQQVCGRSDLDFEQWVELDLYYIDHWSLAEDFRILLRTFQVVVLAKGAA